MNSSMFEHSIEKGSVWVTIKRSSLKSKVQRNKLATAGETIEYRCLIRATDGKKIISTSVGLKEHQRFQASYATILKAHMTRREKGRTRRSLWRLVKEKGVPRSPRRRISKLKRPKNLLSAQNEGEAFGTQMTSREL